MIQKMRYRWRRHWGWRSIVGGGPARGAEAGGVLKVYFFDSPASMSIHEEATIAGQGPMMGVFNNLVMYDQTCRKRHKSIVPDLASEWAWDEAGTGLTFKLRQGVKWHDGKPFTARDVKCTCDLLLGKAAEKLRRQSAQSLVWQSRRRWSRTATTRWRSAETPAACLHRAASLRVLAGLSLPRAAGARCGSIPSARGRSSSSNSSRNEIIRVIRNPDYWKTGRPYLDGIEWTDHQEPARPAVGVRWPAKST